MKGSMDIHAVSPLQSSSEDVIVEYLPENSWGCHRYSSSSGISLPRRINVKPDLGFEKRGC